MPSKTRNSRTTRTTTRKTTATNRVRRWNGTKNVKKTTKNGTSRTFTSPFASTFTSAINRGTPCFVAVNNIANRTNKTPGYVFESLYKAGLCWRQKVAGQWIYFPTNTPKKATATNIKNCQGNMWQWFVDWCIASGYCTPNQLHNCTSNTQFVNFCKKFWGKQFNWNNSSKTRTTTRNYGGRTSKSNGTAAPRSYKFPTVGSRSFGKRKVA